MKFSRTAAAFVTACVAATFVLTGCASSGSGNGGESEAPGENCEPRWDFETIVPGTLTIAAVQQMPATDINPTTGELSGLDTVLLEEFSALNCLKADWQPMSGVALGAALTEGVADVGAGGVFKSEKRGEVFGQTTPTWFDSLGVLAKDEIKSPTDLKGKKVGLIGGAFFEADLIDLIGQDNVVPFQAIDGAIEDLLAGRIDAIYNSGGVLAYLKETRGLDDFKVSLMKFDEAYPVLTAPGEPNIPFTKTNIALGAALDEFLAEKHKDGTIVNTLAELGIKDAKVPEDD